MNKAVLLRSASLPLDYIRYYLRYNHGGDGSGGHGPERRPRSERGGMIPLACTHKEESLFAFTRTEPEGCASTPERLSSGVAKYGPPSEGSGMLLLEGSGTYSARPRVVTRCGGARPSWGPLPGLPWSQRPLQEDLSRYAENQPCAHGRRVPESRWDPKLSSEFSSEQAGRPSRPTFTGHSFRSRPNPKPGMG